MERYKCVCRYTKYPAENMVKRNNILVMFIVNLYGNKQHAVVCIRNEESLHLHSLAWYQNGV